MKIHHSTFCIHHLFIQSFSPPVPSLAWTKSIHSVGRRQSRHWHMEPNRFVLLIKSSVLEIYLSHSQSDKSTELSALTDSLVQPKPLSLRMNLRIHHGLRLTCS